jgi:hypothetical protein
MSVPSLMTEQQLFTYHRWLMSSHIYCTNHVSSIFVVIICVFPQQDVSIYILTKQYKYMGSTRAELEDFGYILPTDTQTGGKYGSDDKLLEHIVKLSQVRDVFRKILVSVFK